MKGSSISSIASRASATFLFLVLTHIPCSVWGQEVIRNVKIHEGVVQTRPRTDAHVLGRRYVWNYLQHSYTIVLEIAVERYNAYNARDRADIADLVREAAETLGPVVREFGAHRKQNTEWSPAERAGFVLAFVQALPYTTDNVTTGYDEFRRFGIETLVDGGGDCEDTTVLAGAILSSLGEDTALMLSPGHIALGLAGDYSGVATEHGGKLYYYCETTGSGWDVGELPPDVRGVTVEPLDGVPALVAPSPTVPGPSPPESDPDSAPETDPTVEPQTEASPPESSEGTARPRGGQQTLVVFLVLASLVLVCGGIYVAIRVVLSSMGPPGAGSGSPPPPRPPTGSSPLDT